MFPSLRRLVSPAFVILGLLGGLITPAMAAGNACFPGPTILCLNGSRFRLTATAESPAGNKLLGQAVSLTPNAGAFWFQSPDNLDLAVKIIDGYDENRNPNKWVIYGSLTSLKYTISITDTKTGKNRSFTNPPESGADFRTFGWLDTPGENSSELPTCTFQPEKPHVDDLVEFSGSYSGFPLPQQWYWKFGDESINAGYSSIKQTTSHTYTSPSDQMNVLLTVEIPNGASTKKVSHFCAKVPVSLPCNLLTSYSGDLSSLPAAGVEGRVTVSTASDCEWSVKSWVPMQFLKILSQTSNSFTFKLSQNFDSSPRSGMLTFSVGTTVVKTLFFSQKGRTCDFMLTPSQVAVGPAGDSGPISIVPTPPNLQGCTWSATGPDCIALSGRTSGVGRGGFSYTVCPNSSTTSRQMTLTVGGKPFVVSQAGCHAGASLTSPPPVGPAPAQPSVGVDVDSPSCEWNAKVEGRFLSLPSANPLSGSFSGNTLQLNVRTNNSSLSRTDSLTIGAQKIPYVQKGCSSVSTNLVDLYPGDKTGTVGVSATSDCQWRAESNAKFIQVPGDKRVGNGDVVFSVDPAGSFERLGALSVAGQIVVVRQNGGNPPPEACTRMTGPDVAGMFDALGGVGHLAVNAHDETCKWGVSTTATHIKMRDYPHTNTVSFCVAANRGGLRGGRMALESSAGTSFFDVLQTAPDGGDPTLSCSDQDSGALCLRRGRFEVRATFGDVPNLRQAAQAVGLTDSYGYFWFYDPTNPELVVKIVDGRSDSGSFQVYSGGLTSVPYALTVTDTLTGKQTLFCNFDNNLSFQSFKDTTTFTP